jgi:hypothetical protein
MLAKLSVDLRVAIHAEGRLPEAVVLVFPEPTKRGEVVVRVNEYLRSELTNRVCDAVAEATRPDGASETLDMVDPMHPWRPNVASKVTYRHPDSPPVERE